MQIEHSCYFLITCSSLTSAWPRSSIECDSLIFYRLRIAESFMGMSSLTSRSCLMKR